MPAHRFSDEQVERANRANLLEYARTMGYELIPVSRQAWKIPNLGGLFIHADGTRWNCFSKNAGGGPIQFVMHVQNITWAEAVNQLVGSPEQVVSSMQANRQILRKKEDTSIELESDELNRSAITQKDVKATIRMSDQQQTLRGLLELPHKGETLKHVLAYLIAYRKIDKEIVYDMIKQGTLYENDKHSCVFVGKDEHGVPRFASVRSTNTQSNSFRADVQNSDKAYSFSIKGTNDQLHVFESPIDLLSYLTLAKRNGISGFQSHMLSLGGVSGRSLVRYLKAYPEIRNVTLCLDNDEAGQAATRELTNRLRGKVAVSVHIPLLKDWNEDLVAQMAGDYLRYMNECDRNENAKECCDKVNDRGMKSVALYRSALIEEEVHSR